MGAIHNVPYLWWWRGVEEKLIFSYQKAFSLLFIAWTVQSCQTKPSITQGISCQDQIVMSRIPAMFTGLVPAASNSAGIWDSDNCSSQELFLDAKEPHPLYILHGVHSIFQQFAIARFGNAPLCCVSCAALAGPAMALLPGDSMVTSFAWEPFWQKTWCYSVQLLHPGMTHP